LKSSRPPKQGADFLQRGSSGSKWWNFFPRMGFAGDTRLGWNGTVIRRRYKAKYIYPVTGPKTSVRYLNCGLTLFTAVTSQSYTGRPRRSRRMAAKLPCCLRAPPDSPLAGLLSQQRQHHRGELYSRDALPFRVFPLGRNERTGFAADYPPAHLARNAEYEPSKHSRLTTGSVSASVSLYAPH